ncbi:terminus macrodomain insulation protein YfbV [Flocculibacter collagenilyticus]|uniref:terminus macrodomain insulation protein YfbV n=1 Tax=Flocculibacter collagenilyticus TaxID=2744479 RepID=UPI0018F3B27C|nr:terminus macrodomain insulation protein YfbV [Flocculibacter collagenilyticus]
MPKSLMSLIRDGQSYSKMWPMRSELATYFPEYRVIKATQFAINVLPMVAVMSVFIQYQYLGTEYLPQAITFALFILSIPVQGLLWLGKRSNTLLPPSTALWYKEVYQKMKEQGCQLSTAKARPKYIELAMLLKRAFDEMDKAFTKDLF